MATSAQPRTERRFVVETHNTIEIRQDEVIRIVTPYSGAYYYNLLNIGPCTVYYREGREPEPGDEYSVTLPPFTADDLVVIPDGPEGLLMVTGGPCAYSRGATAEHNNNHPNAIVTLRLVRG